MKLRHVTGGEGNEGQLSTLGCSTQYTPPYLLDKDINFYLFFFFFQHIDAPKPVVSILTSSHRALG